MTYAGYVAQSCSVAASNSPSGEPVITRRSERQWPRARFLRRARGRSFFELLEKYVSGE